jgi:hypothetical protein
MQCYDNMEPTRTTLTQKESRVLLKSRAAGKLAPLTIAFLRYLTQGCYFKNPIARRMEPKDFEVSAASIAAYMGCSEPTALHHFKIAEELKLITVLRFERGRSNAYSLHLDEMYGWPTTKKMKKLQKQKRKNAKAEYQRRYRETKDATSTVQRFFINLQEENRKRAEQFNAQLTTT